jgi:adenylate cyclase
VLHPPKFLRGIGVRQVRLATGLILFSYLLSHYLNHALGNISLDVMEYGLLFHMALWRSVPGTTLLYPALAVHACLGLWALYDRRQFKACVRAEHPGAALLACAQPALVGDALGP